MYCSQCGTESQANVQFCRNCGLNMHQEIAPLSPQDKPSEPTRPWISFPKRKTLAEKREAHISKGVVSLFSGVGLTTFLYFLSAALVLKLPPHIIAQIPFEIDPVVKVIWLFGLIPATAGLGHIIAGLLIRPQQDPQPQLEEVVSPPRELRTSVTDRTTNLLEQRLK